MSSDDILPQRNMSSLIKYALKYKEILHKLISEYIKHKFKCSVLDIGCKWGDDLKKVAKLDVDIYAFGMDIYFDALKVASERLDEHHYAYFIQAKGETIPFKDNCFDVIISSEVIEHINDVQKFIKEIYRVLKKGGILIITTPSRFNYVALVGKITPLPFKKFLRKLTYYCRQCGDEKPHVREYTPQELKRLFEKNKFIVKHIIGGPLRIPVWLLFLNFPFLLPLWKCIDKFIDTLPGGIHLKHNFIMEVEKCYDSE